MLKIKVCLSIGRTLRSKCLKIGNFKKVNGLVACVLKLVLPFSELQVGILRMPLASFFMMQNVLEGRLGFFFLGNQPKNPRIQKMFFLFRINVTSKNRNKYISHTSFKERFGKIVKAELLQLNCTQFPSLGIFVSKKVGNRKN